MKSSHQYKSENRNIFEVESLRNNEVTQGGVPLCSQRAFSPVVGMFHVMNEF